MISLKVLSTAAAMALVLPMVPAASFAQQQHPGVSGGVRVGAAPGPRYSGAPGPRFNGGGAPGPRYSGGGYRRGGGYIPGAVAGAVAAGVIVGYPGYYPPGYYDDQYYEDAPVAVVPDAGDGDDAVAYCMQTYRSYDPGSGTYLGNDGFRHPCP
ncbi:MAG: BA14K family protein [Bradyrhizobium sp.]|nr:BA14K family protein [Bradyrhizobium sp.]THD62554.1 MAG: BA14K family protein [Bradyrhizobium sp.]